MVNGEELSRDEIMALFAQTEGLAFLKGKWVEVNHARLRETVAPFIFRRLKTDPTVISDLPNKTEILTYVDVTKKQTMLYRSVIEKLAHALKGADGIQRKGLVLQAISKLKQICNHPDEYLEQAAYMPEESGKFKHLKELCQTIYEKRERVLVFTQFREMTEPLSRYLQTVFHREGLVIHGGVSAKMRTKLVEQFQGENYIPNPQEIHFTCNCPDWASMCKHVAAVLYGIGNPMEDDPLLFFAMRGIDVNDFIKSCVEEKFSKMLKNADTLSPRVIEDQSLESLFGVL